MDVFEVGLDMLFWTRCHVLTTDVPMAVVVFLIFVFFAIFSKVKVHDGMVRFWAGLDRPNCASYRRLSHFYFHFCIFCFSLFMPHK